MVPSLLRQCARHAIANVRPSRQLRALAASAVLCQSSDDKPSYAPGWIDERNRLRPPQPANNMGYWNNIIWPSFQVETPKKETAEEWWKAQETSSVRNLPAPHNAYSGRSVPVYKGEVGVAFSQLNAILKINTVRYTKVKDERHEKKGEKRNRLKSLRWRRRFAHEVRKRVQLVNEIRARGA